MKRHEELKFADVQVTRSQLVSYARNYIGLPYKIGSTWVDETRTTGHANCFGILLLVAQDCGLLPMDFDVNIPPAKWGQSEGKTLWEIIDYNFTEVPLEEMQGGDVILMRYKDVDPSLREPHHVAMCIEPAYGYGYPTIIHASQNTGSVYACLTDPLYLQRIESIWKLNNLKENE
jgi:hypothetical protein